VGLRSARYRATRAVDYLRVRSLCRRQLLLLRLVRQVLRFIFYGSEWEGLGVGLGSNSLDVLQEARIAHLGLLAHISLQGLHAFVELDKVSSCMVPVAWIRRGPCRLIRSLKLNVWSCVKLGGHTLPNDVI